MPGSRFSSSLVLVAFLASAQAVVASTDEPTLFLGNRCETAGARVSWVGEVTAVHLNSPANASGWIRRVRIEAERTCSQALFVSTFRQVGREIRRIRDLGPYDLAPGTMEIALDPPVWVEQGDLLGITNLLGSCGWIRQTAENGSQLTWIAGRPDSFSLADAVSETRALAVSAEGDAVEEVAAVIPVVVSADGLGGSRFVTSVRMLAPTGYQARVRGRLVLHPAGRSGLPDDPSVPIDLTNENPVSISDVVGSLGLEGLYSADLVIPTATGIPTVVTEIRNAGAGTAGTAHEPLAVTRGDSCESPFVMGPATGTRIFGPNSSERLNIGARSLDLPASVGFTISGGPGGPISYASFDLPPRTLLQAPWTRLAGGPTAASASVRVFVSFGECVVYASYVDDETNQARFVYLTAGDPPNATPLCN